MEITRTLSFCVFVLVIFFPYPGVKGKKSGRFGGSKSGSTGKFKSSSFGSFSKPSYLSGHGSSQSHKASYPSGSGLSGYGSSGSSNPSYPSGSGLSGYGSSGSSNPSYPSGSGLSGYGSSGSNNPSYPSGSGLSGYGSSGSSNPSYPSGSGLSGYGSSGSNNPSYPSGSGLSGYGSSGSSNPSYPSGSGLSGYGSSGSRKPSYPSGSGLSGHSSGRYNKPWYSSGTNYGSGGSSYNNYGHSLYNNGQHGHTYGMPSYHSGPQIIYVSEYRNSGSRYQNLLTGLALYNLGRSHNSYNHHYYHDDYYARRNHGSGHVTNGDTKPVEAKCLLKIKEKDKVQILKVPCDIVSTFTEGSKNVTEQTSNLINNKNTTVSCVSVVSIPINGLLVNSTFAANGTLINSTLCEKVLADSNCTDLVISMINSTKAANSPFSNSTICKTNQLFSSSNETDPLSVKGPPLNVTKEMECSVEIQTKSSTLRQNVDCSILMKFAKMPEPKKESSIAPQRSTLKSWKNSLPWWLAMFIAV